MKKYVLMCAAATAGLSGYTAAQAQEAGGGKPAMERVTAPAGSENSLVVATAAAAAWPGAA